MDCETATVVVDRVHSQWVRKMIQISYTSSASVKQGGRSRSNSSADQPDSRMDQWEEEGEDAMDDDEEDDLLHSNNSATRNLSAAAAASNAMTMHPSMAACFRAVSTITVSLSLSSSTTTLTPTSAAAGAGLSSSSPPPPLAISSVILDANRLCRLARRLKLIAGAMNKHLVVVANSHTQHKSGFPLSSFFASAGSSSPSRPSGLSASPPPEENGTDSADPFFSPTRPLRRTASSGTATDILAASPASSKRSSLIGSVFSYATGANTFTQDPAASSVIPQSNTPTTPIPTNNSTSNEAKSLASTSWRLSSFLPGSSAATPALPTSLPSHRTAESLHQLLEAAKSFISRSLSRDALRAICARQAFEDQWKELNDRVHAWATDLEITQASSLWKQLDTLDAHRDLRLLWAVVEEFVGLSKGDLARVKEARKAMVKECAPPPVSRRQQSARDSTGKGKQVASSPLSTPTSRLGTLGFWRSAVSGSSRYSSQDSAKEVPIVSGTDSSAPTNGEDKIESEDSISSSGYDTDEEPLDLLKLLRLRPNNQPLLPSHARRGSLSARRGSVIAFRQAAIVTEATLFVQSCLAERTKRIANNSDVEAVFAGVADDKVLAENSSHRSIVELTDTMAVEFLQAVLEGLPASSGGNTDKSDESSGYVNEYDIEDMDDGVVLESLKSAIYEPWKVCLVSRKTPSGLGTGDNSRVGVLRLRKGLSPEQCRNFAAEVSLCMKLAPHKHVLPIIGLNANTNPCFLVTPNIPMTRPPPTDLLTHALANPGHALRLLHETALGIAHLHAQGILHMDLRASNILILSTPTPNISKAAPTPVTTRAVVAGFGVPWSVRSNMAHGLLVPHRNGLSVSPSRWVSPEVLRGATPRPPSDVYSFGLIIWELVSGGLPPYWQTTQSSDSTSSLLDEEDETDRETSAVSKIMHGNALLTRPTPLSRCPELVWTLTQQCTSRDPLSRPVIASGAAQQGLLGVADRLADLVKRQAKFRRASKIKAFAEAFIVDVPLGDLMPEQLAELNTSGSSSSSSAGSVTGSMSSGEDKRKSKRYSSMTVSADGSDESVVDSAYTRSPKISMNLAFSLDGVVGPPHPASAMAHGIDLPPVEDADEEEGNQESASSAGAEEQAKWRTDAGVMRVWKEVSSFGEEGVESVPWSRACKGLKRRYPTLVLSESLRKRVTVLGQHGGDEPVVSISSLVHFVMTSRTVSSMTSNAVTVSGTSNGSDFVDLAFAPFCLVCNADTDATASGPLEVSRIKDWLTQLGPTAMAAAGNISTSATAASKFLLDLVSCADALAVLEVLLDPTVMKASSDASSTLPDRLPPFNVNSSDAKGWTLLHIACRGTSGTSSSIAGRIVRLLLDAGADPTARTTGTLWTPLHVAAWTGCLGAVRELVAADVGLCGAEDSEGWTALVHAARYGKGEVVSFLIESDRAGANLKKAKELALSMARKHKQEEVAELLS